LADDHGQEVMGLGKKFAATSGMLVNSGLSSSNATNATWHHGFLYSQALTIGGGTSAVQRNIIAERVLGLAKDATA
jgi:alkylation response protein AidB-like acyl-CoA dehydrogenase